MSVDYIDRQHSMGTAQKLKQLQARHVELQQELGYYKAKSERLERRIAQLQQQIREGKRHETTA